MHSNDANPLIWSWFQPPPTTQPQPPIIYPIIIQQFVSPNAMPCCGGCTMILHSCSSLFCAEPVYQSMAQQYQYQYRAPSSGPSRSQRSKGRRKAEAQHLNQLIHESSRTIGRDRYAGIHLGHAQMDAKDNPGAGGAWRPPTRNPLLVDYNSPRQTTPYDRHRSGPRTRRSRRDKADLSVYEIPIVDSESMSIPSFIDFVYLQLMCRRRCSDTWFKHSSTGTINMGDSINSCTCIAHADHDKYRWTKTYVSFTGLMEMVLTYFRRAGRRRRL